MHSWAVKRLYEKLKDIEKKLLFGEALEAYEIDSLKLLFLEVKNTDRWFRHLLEASKSMNSNLDLNKLMTFIVPIERELGRKVTDLDLVISKDDKKEVQKEQKLKIVLDNIRSAFNTGAILRTCDALGVCEVIMTGYTQGLESAQVLKTSMGAKPKITKLRDLIEVKKYLEGYKLIALETSNQSKNIYESKLYENTAFVLGNERFGLSEKDLLICDAVTKLPMNGIKNSLNVNAALAACGYEWIRRFGQ